MLIIRREYQKTKYWCPKGCGKKVVYANRSKEGQDYLCLTCFKRYNKEEVK